MKKIFFVFLVATLFVAGCSVNEQDPTSPDATTVTIKGAVTDSITSIPLAYAVVRVLDGTTELTAATTNNSGVFSTSVSITGDKTLELSVIKEGYNTYSKFFKVDKESGTQNFSVKLVPQTTSADSVVIVGNVIDAKFGNPLEGAEIRFYQASLAMASATTDNNGAFTVKFPMTGTKELQVITVKASYTADTTTVVATSGSVTNMPAIKLMPLVDAIAGEPASIFIVSQTLDAIGVTESGSPETAKIVFEVQDSSGIPIDLEHAVTVNFRFGAAPGGGEILAPGTAKTDASGQVMVNLTSGTVAGAVQIIAEIDFKGEKIVSKPVNIAIHGGLPDLTHFSIGTDLANYPYYHKLAGKVKVTALVGDKYTNPVKPKTVVYFYSDAAVIQGSALTTESGTADVTLLSGNPLPNDPTDGPGFFYIHARTINEKEEIISAKTRVLFSGYPTVSVSPNSFNIPNGGSQSFTYTVQDEFGHPLASGNSFSVSISTAGEAGVAGDIAITMPDVQSGNLTYNFVITDSNPNENNNAPATILINVNGPNGIATLAIDGFVN
jgi:hypothetical protein